MNEWTHSRDPTIFHRLSADRNSFISICAPLCGRMEIKMNPTVIDCMKAKNIRFSPGLTDCDFTKIEAIYGVSFPQSLRKFYSGGVPFTDVEYEFPHWNDFSLENIEKIKKRMRAPIEQLLEYLKTDHEYWAWGDRPAKWEDAEKAFE